jgi:hypothetical protein
MSEDRSDALVVTLRYAGGRGQRLIVEPGSDDPRADHTLHEETLTRGGEFLPAGSDPVETIAIEGAVDADPVREHLEAVLDAVDAQEPRYRVRQALQLLDALEVGL